MGICVRWMAQSSQSKQGPPESTQIWYGAQWPWIDSRPTGVGLGTIFLNCGLDIDVIPAGQARADAQGAFRIGERFCYPRAVPGSSRAHKYTYCRSTHPPMAGERRPRALTEQAGGPRSSLWLGQLLWLEEADGHSPPQHRPRSRQGWTHGDSPPPSCPASCGAKWWQMHVNRGNLITPPPFPTHTGTGHNTALSLQLAEETTQAILHQQLPVAWAEPCSHHTGVWLCQTNPSQGFSQPFPALGWANLPQNKLKGKNTHAKNPKSQGKQDCGTTALRGAQKHG